MDRDELRFEMSKLPMPDDALPPSWNHWRHELYQHITHGEDPGDFMRWPCIYHTMLINHWNMKAQYAELYPESARWEKAFRIKDGDLHVDKHDFTNYSMNLIHQCYHLKQWEDSTGKKAEELDAILDFGAGYGAMALVINRLGFKGEYMIFDLPEFSLLQQWYLSKQGIENICWFTDANELKRQRKDYDLMIAVWSFDEVSFLLRDSFLNGMNIKNFMFLYSLNCLGYDNDAWFDRFMQRQFRFKWNVMDDKHIAGGNRYAIGYKGD